jgi:hypothetical protein
MPNVMNFYIDESGTRHPDHDPGKRAAHGYDWFAFGGILVKEEDEPKTRQLHAKFQAKWDIRCPLHSSEIRGQTDGFHWLADRDKADQERFYEQLYVFKTYYGELTANGMPFAVDTSEHYGPLSPEEFRKTLYEFKLKSKSSPMAQLADLYLWPICMGGYHAGNRPYERLKSDGKLIECLIPEQAWENLGTKYSCFDLVQRNP